MPIGSLSTPQYRFTQPEGPVRPTRAVTKRLDNYMRNYDLCYERVAKVRAQVMAKKNNVHSFDSALMLPEQFRNPVVRALIHVAKHLEEMAEGIADISGLCERLTRNLISSGEKSDIALVIASAVGRVLAGQLSFPGIALHKLLGCALYGVSNILSFTALGLIKTGLAARRNEAETLRALGKSNFDSSAYLLTANTLLSAKEQLLSTILDKAGEPSGQRKSAIQKWVRYMSRQQSSTPPNLPSKRKANCNYIWENLHQYGPLTRSLMHIAYGTFQGINKLMVSYDKHAGAAIGNHVLAKKLGSILGCRVGMAFSVGTAAALSVPLSPFVVGVSSIGAMACGVALLALVLAKLNVRLTNDWKGSIQRPYDCQVFGRVTPTCP